MIFNIFISVYEVCLYQSLYDSSGGGNGGEPFLGDEKFVSIFSLGKNQDANKAF